MLRSNKIKEEHETMKLQNDEVMPQTFEIVINKVNSACIKWEKFSEKSFLQY